MKKKKEVNNLKLKLFVINNIIIFNKQFQNFEWFEWPAELLVNMMITASKF